QILLPGKTTTRPHNVCSDGFRVRSMVPPRDGTLEAVRSNLRFLRLCHPVDPVGPRPWEREGTLPVRTVGRQTDDKATIAQILLTRFCDPKAIPRETERVPPRPEDSRARRGDEKPNGASTGVRALRTVSPRKDTRTKKLPARFRRERQLRVQAKPLGLE